MRALSPSVSFPYHERLSSRFFFSLFIYLFLSHNGWRRREKQIKKKKWGAKKEIHSADVSGLTFPPFNPWATRRHDNLFSMTKGGMPD
jgi:hypothetical protein